MEPVLQSESRVKTALKIGLVAMACKLVSVETPLNATYTRAQYSFEILAGGRRVAQFKEGAFREATEALKNLKDAGVCSSVELGQRSEQVLP